MHKKLRKIKELEPIASIASRVIKGLIEKMIKPQELNQPKNDISSSGTKLTSRSNKKRNGGRYNYV